MLIVESLYSMSVTALGFEGSSRAKVTNSLGSALLTIYQGFFSVTYSNLEASVYNSFKRKEFLWF